MSDRFVVYLGDCREVLAGLEPESVDAVVTDPPYELGFMGKAWDRTGVAFDPATWAACLRVLKPGGHLLAFAGSRTYHRIACAIEDAGFEVRDQIMWLYGSGFPKSHDVSKAIDKEAGIWRGRAGAVIRENGSMHGGNYERTLKGDPATPEAERWSGWGTALKPAHEPIVVARKPFRGTVATNVLAHGTGALNIDGCRVKAEHGDDPLRWAHGRGMGFHGAENLGPCEAMTSSGRWPANVIHDGSEEVVERLGEPARFFYAAKASKRDREEGLDGFDVIVAGGLEGRSDGSQGSITRRANHHPTVKPTDLMRYLCRLVTPPGGIVLDPFTGSGSTGKAAVLEGFRFVGCELSPEYREIALARIAHAAREPG